ncbi:MAG: hypothetical protein CSA33_01875 [Desulfobulbus propionicus]|nr:MAG: hypothetical protein CSA33_01875 [Desulfobulbus propionicus]
MADQVYNQQAAVQAVYDPHATYTQQPVSTPPVYPAPSTSLLGINVQDTQFWKGALIGAAVTLLLTNESVQKGVVKTVSKVTAAAQCGIEEMKEKFEDAKAEAIAESQTKVE